MAKRRLEAGRDTVEIIGQEILAKVPGRFPLGPGLAGLLIRADQHAAALLAHVNLALEVDDVKFVDLGIDHAGNIFCDEIMVFHRQDRQLDADHAPDFARPKPAAIDDMLSDDRAFIRDDIPSAVGPQLQIDNASEAVDFGPRHRCAFGIGVSDAPRIQMPFDRIEHGADKMLLFDEGVHFCRLFYRENFKIHAEIATARPGHFEPVEAFFRARKIETAGDMHPAGNAGDGFDLFVEIDRILL